MAIRDKLRSNAAHVLQPGEVIQAVFSAMTTSPWFGLLVWKLARSGWKWTARHLARAGT